MSYENLCIKSTDEFIYGRCPKPISCGHGVEIGSGLVVPELNFTLPAIDIHAGTMPQVCKEYTEMITGALKRAVELETPSVLIEFETLPPMTIEPLWGLDVTRILADKMKEAHDKHGLKSALRLTPNDTREFERPPLMRQGRYWEKMLEMFDQSAEYGADLISIESTGGKEVHDEALVNGDLPMAVFALGILACRDMKFLWEHIVASCNKQGIVPAGDSACGFANTAMVLADKKMIPRIFSAVIRVATVPRALAAFEAGAKGPSKDCAYEGPYMKAIAGVPISMEGRTAACAHLSPVGNISQAVCDCWSNESVQNIQLLSGKAPTVSMEQLIYDCRLMDVASKRSKEDAMRLRDWLVESDAALDPQAHVLRPDVVLKLSSAIMEESTPYLRTRRAVQATLEELERAHKAGEVKIDERELGWFSMLQSQADELPDDEQELIEDMLDEIDEDRFAPAEYEIEV